MMALVNRSHFVVERQILHYYATRSITAMWLWKLLWPLLTVWVGSLPTPENSVHARSDQELTESVSILKEKASVGMVRVIVKIRPLLDRTGTPADANQPLESAKSSVATVMRQAGVPVVEPLEGQPLIVMELTAEQLDRLVATGLVESIQEDRIDRAF